MNDTSVSALTTKSLPGLVRALKKRIKTTEINVSAEAPSDGFFCIEFSFLLDREATVDTGQNPSLDVSLRIPNTKTEMLVRFEALDQNAFASEGCSIAVPCRLRLLLNTGVSPEDGVALVERLRILLELLFPGRSTRKPKGKRAQGMRFHP